MKKFMFLAILGLVAMSSAAFAREVSVTGSSIESCDNATRDAANQAPHACAEWEYFVEVKHDRDGCSTMKVNCGDGGGYTPYECTKYIMSSKAICVRQR